MRVFYMLLLTVPVFCTKHRSVVVDLVDRRCDKNEHYRENYNGCHIKCENKDLRDMMGACVPTSGCFCDDGYVRNKHGACIKEDKCPKPKCKANREYSDCGSSCPETCEDNFSYNSNRTCIAECISGCFCKSGLVEDKIGQCIKLEMCPTPKCDRHRKFQECGSSCPESCSNRNDPERICSAECVRGCFCRPGLVEDGHGNCVRPRKCPKPECGKNRVFEICGSPCPDSCANMHDPGRICSAECVRGCFCRPGLVEDGHGNCVRPRRCPKPAPVCEDPNAEYSDCGSSCPSTCSDLRQEQSCTLACQPGCFCKPGYVLDNNSLCVLPSQCPNQCGTNEVFKECKTTCPPQACSAIGALFKCVEPPPCEPGCDCLPGFLRDDSGTCIIGTTCPKKGCGGDPHAEPGCGFHCGKSCSTYKIPKDKLSLVCPRIACPRGGCECSGEYVYDDITKKCVLPTECHIGPDVCSDPNSQYSLCGSACPETCDNFQDPNRTCTRQCVVGCFCNEGYVKDSSGKCVLYSQCSTATCPDNEVFKDCRTVCPPQTCLSMLARYNCSLEEPCSPGCDCNPGFLRNSSGTCIKSTSCFPADGCGYNEVWSDCKIECPPQTCESIFTSYSCDEHKLCSPGCNCLNGYLRNSTGICIPSKQCPGPQPTCGTNEVYNDCGTACPKTCKNKDLLISCLEVCESGCFCVDGYVRNDNGVCVLPDQCPPEPTCGANEVYNNCGTACPKTCQNKDVEIACIDICVPGCFCAEGFVRNPSGVCVLPDQCPAKCTDPNSVFTTCGTACPDSCDNYRQENRFCTRECVIGCACKEGYVFDNAKSSTRRCIRPDECPNQCGAHEVYKSCKTVCPPQTCNATGSYFKCDEAARCEPGCDCLPGYLRDDSSACIDSTACPKTGCGGDLHAEPGCGLHCGKSCSTYRVPEDKLSLVCPRIACPRGSCECSGEYVYDDITKKCVLPSECPKPTCGANEKYSECGTACPKTCNNKDLEIACISVCESGCFCNEGYVRNDNGSCILPNQCPSPTCPENEQYTSCIPAICEPQRCDQLGTPIACALIVGPCTDSGCICKTGYLRNDSNVCVPKDTCPPQVVCGENEAFTKCGSACPKTCKTKSQEVLCPANCKVGCFCIDGYIRDDNGACILKEKCPSVEQCPDTNAEYKTCGSACPDTCDNYQNTNRTCIRQCVLGCACKTGYVLDSTGKCVHPSQCPSKECPENEIFGNCGTACPKTCDNMNEESLCSEVCKSGCFCKDEFVRNNKGVCVVPEQCPQNQCKANETYANCNARCPADYCPSDDNPTPVCDPPNPCPPGCRCNINYRLNKENECILASECPPVECTRPNEVFDSCPSACLAESCEDVDSQPTTCNTLLLNCDPRCVCRHGHFRNASGICVPAEQCSARTCPENEQYASCVAAICEPQRCDQLGRPIACAAVAEPCNDGGCVCKEGYLRNDNDICVPKDICSAQPKCGANEIFTECGSACPKTCKTKSEEVLCPAICKVGCFCIDGYIRDDTGACIPSDKCPQTCPVNEVYQECGTACPKTCKTKDIDFQCIEKCRPGCFCADGYIRNDDGVCVLPENGPHSNRTSAPTDEQCSDPNAEYTTCGSACPDTCDNYGNPNRTCTLQCVLGCACKTGYVLDSTGKCVLPSQCPSKECPENEIYSTCGTACPKTCDNINEENICIEVCKSGCFCKDNLVRNNEGVCVVPEQCPCNGDPNLESGCSNGCAKNCRNKDLSQAQIRLVCPRVQCLAGSCQCGDGLYYDDVTSSCVPKADCP